MKARTLISNRLYFGLDPLVFRRGAGRVLTRLGRIPPQGARISPKALAQDFRLEPDDAEPLLQALLAQGLIQHFPGHAIDYQLTERFTEFALARVVPPLPRARAKELLDQASRLAERINAEWTANPLFIYMIAVSGSYMSRSGRIDKLELWPVVKRRLDVHRSRFGASISRTDGASEISSALRALSSFIQVRIVSNEARIDRPFAVPFRDEGEPLGRLAATGTLRGLGATLRHLMGR